MVVSGSYQQFSLLVWEFAEIQVQGLEFAEIQVQPPDNRLLLEISVWTHVYFSMNSDGYI